MTYKDKSSIVGANILFALVVLLFVSLGSIVQGKNLIIGLLITEYIIVLLPSLLYLKLKKKPFKKTLRLNRIKFIDVIRVILITIFTYALAVFMQAVFISILNSYSSIEPNNLALPNKSSQLPMAFLVMAISPGICEEIMFRGVLLDGYRGLGPRRAILLSSFLFAIMHMTIANFIGTFFLGIVFGVMVYKTDSIYSAIIGHITNNTIALGLGYFLTNPNITNLNMQRLANYFLVLLIFAIPVVGNLFENLGNRENILITEKEEGNKIDLTSAWIYSPILVVLIIYIYINTNFVVA